MPSNGTSNTRGVKRILLIVSAVCLIVFSIWRFATFPDGISLSFKPKAAFSGRICVTVLDSKTTRFLVDLKTGEISESFKLPDVPQGEGGHFGGCSGVSVLAPNGDFDAQCDFRSAEGGGAKYSVEVFKVSDHRSVKHWIADEKWGPIGFAWSPDSSSLGVLEERDRLSLSPIDLIWFISGHPIQLSSFKLTLLSTSSEQILEVPIFRKDSRMGWGRVDWMKE